MSNRDNDVETVGEIETHSADNNLRQTPEQFESGQAPTETVAGNVMPMDTVEKGAFGNQPVRRQSPELSQKQIITYGAVGGILTVLVTGGMFDQEKISTMLQGNNPGIQLTTFVIFGAITASAGAFWAYVHRPIHSIMIAVQLGVIAPAAINALITVAPNIETTKGASLLNGLFMSTAHASSHETTTTPKPTILDCIKSAIVKRPC